LLLTFQKRNLLESEYKPEDNKSEDNFASLKITFVVEDEFESI
jgi:hypothetical protein